MTDKTGTEGQTQILSCVTMTASPAGIGEEEMCLYRASWGFAGGIGLLPSRFHCNLGSHRSEKHSGTQLEHICGLKTATTCSAEQNTLDSGKSGLWVPLVL